MFGRMLIGAISRQRGKVFMIAVSAALGASLASAMINVMLGVGDKVNMELKTYGANLSVSPRGTSLISDLYSAVDGPAESGKYLAEDEIPKIKTVFWAFNIVDFAPYLEERATVANGDSSADAVIAGTWFEKHLDIPTGESVDTGMKRLKSWWEVRGEWADDKSGMIGSRLASKLGVSPGDSVTVTAASDTKVKIAGVFESGGEEDDRIFLPLAVAQGITGLPGKVSRLEVSALTTPENELARRAAQDPNSLSRLEWDAWYCTAYISSIAYQIEEVITDSRAKPVLSVAEGEGAILRKTQLLMSLLTVLALTCSALAISNLVTASVIERTAEIGLLKAIGAGNAAISVLLISEIMLTSMCGGAVGFFAGVGFAKLIGRAVFGGVITAHTLAIPIVALLVALVAVAGSLPAIRMLLSLRPAETLHGR
jgi:putative ABC transport system permease protein